MKLIKSIVRPNKVDDVKDALAKLNISGMTVTEVRGHGKQKGHTAIYRGKEYNVSLLPKMEIEIVVPDSITEDAIKAIVTGGRGLMRPVPAITDSEMPALIAYLATTGVNRPGGRGRGGAAPVFPPGPVVARGGAPLPAAPPRSLGPFYPGLGGNAGSYIYPDDATGLPATRYMSDYGVLASWTKPPYTTITAYDLNTGEIRWQVPNGDHPPTIAAGGPSNSSSHCRPPTPRSIVSRGRHSVAASSASGRHAPGVV